MTIPEICKELEEIKKDSSLKPDEREIYLSIFNAELERIKYDAYINAQREAISKSRDKIIDDTMNVMPNLDEDAREVAMTVVNDLAINPANKVSAYVNTVPLVVDEKNNASEMYVYYDSKIQKEIEELEKQVSVLDNIINTKYVLIQDKLGSLVDPELFELESKINPGDMKERSELGNALAQQNKKINDLGIGSKEKGILRNIVNDVVKNSGSMGQMYRDFPVLEDRLSSLEGKNSNHR